MGVKVCDAICGSGKTSACIRMMNERTDVKFIFVTQYLTEVDKILEQCKARGFVTPDGDVDEGRTKLSSIHKLIAAGKNIATTHALFVSYTEETKRLIQENNYILVLDETVDVLCMSNVEICDIDILLRSKSIREEDGVFQWLDDNYGKNGEGKFIDEMMRAKSKNLMRYDQEYFFWAIPPELFTCFKEAYVLTYLFKAQTLRCFFDLYGIEYERIGVKLHKGKYEFCDAAEMDRKRDLISKIHILDDRKVNEIGEPRTALSFTWYKTVKKEDEGALERMRKNVSNVFKNKWKAPGAETMWTTFKSYKEELAGKGYANTFVSYNKRASNDYRDRKYLAYCVNNFPRPWEARYFRDRGVEVDGDGYALSILVQWIFRSAVRCGEEVWVYVPSRRMRTLLMKWLDLLAEGRDLEPITAAQRVRRKKGAQKDGSEL